MRTILFVIITLAVWPTAGTCGIVNIGGSDSIANSRAEHVEDSLFALRHTYSAYRMSGGWGIDDGINDGTGLLLLGSYQTGHNLFSFAFHEYSTSSGFEYRLSPWETTRQFGILYGVASTRSYTFASASGGIAYVRRTREIFSRDSAKFIDTLVSTSGTQSLAFTMQVQTGVSVGNIFGLEFYCYATAPFKRAESHRLFSDYGLGFDFQFGDWAVDKPIMPDDVSEFDIGDTMPFAGPRPARNSFYFELFGSGQVFSLHYDRLLSEHFSMSVGAAAVDDPDATPGPEFILPLAMHYFTLPRNDGMEGAVGYAPVFHQDPSARAKILSHVITTFIGYRFQQFSGGEFCRVGYAPSYSITDGKGIPINFSICAGLTF